MPALFVEVRCEELPARRVRAAAEALRDGLRAGLAEAGLLEGEGGPPSPPLGTPRRLAAHVADVRARRADRSERAWGPPVAAAFAPDGRPTKAGEGFARSVGVALEAMGRGEKQAGKPPYLYADRVLPGAPAADLIPGILREVLRGLPFRKTMRWPGSDLPFARPVRGLVVLLGGEVVPCTLAGVTAGRTTRGHAFLAPDPIELATADVAAYRDALRSARVLVDGDERRARIREAVVAARTALEAAAADWDAADGGLLDEVEGLVEWPSALAGAFDAAYAVLPPAVLVTSMAHHLRYFPVRAAGGGLLPRFVSVTDRDASAADGIRAGNERVLRARLYDARFFLENDRKRRLEEFRPALAGVDFHRGLGTLLEKSENVRAAGAALADRLALAADQRTAVDRAGFLLKCDLVTEVVKEFPELQGQIGAEYARRDGESRSVAAALAAQYAPHHERAEVLADPAAAVVAVAERADSLAAYFSIGEEPTGSADPFGLRRHAIGLLHVLEATRWPLSVEEALAPACAARRVPAEAMPRLHAFVWARAGQRARDDGFVDFIECVGAPTDLPFHLYGDRLRALRALSAREDWKDLVALVERTGNMGRAGPVDAAALPAAGKAVAAALARVDDGDAGGGPEAFGARFAAALAAPVAALFDAVLVDDPAEPERTAALRALLHDVFRRFADRVGDLRRLGSGARPPRA